MKRLLIFIGIVVLTGCEEPPQTAKELLQRNVLASGGVANWTGLNSLTSSYHVRTTIGNNGTTEQYQSKEVAFPDKLRIDSYVKNRKTNTTVQNATDSYFIKFESGNPIGITILPRQELYKKMELNLLNRADELVFAETIWEGTPMYEIRDTIKNARYLFDGESYLLKALVNQTTYGESTTTYSDYREVDGLQFAFSEVQRVPRSAFTKKIEIDSIQVNPSLDEGLFQMDHTWNVIKEGNELPDFELTIHGKDQKINKESLKGKVTLVDFWATWCGPCIKEFPNMKKLYSTYRDHGFEIVGISIDSEERLMVDYLKKSQLPWKNGWIAGGFESELAKTFQLASLPKPILVNGEGQIIATDDQARGTHLEALLSSLFHK